MTNAPIATTTGNEDFAEETSRFGFAIENHKQLEQSNKGVVKISYN